MSNIPGYRVQGLLQRTSRFHTYRATRISDQRPVVLKRPAKLCPSIEEIRQFKYEYKILGKKNIYGTIRILGLIKHEYNPVLVLEDFDGIPCSELLYPAPGSDEPTAPQRLPIGEFVDIAVKLAAALASVHQHDIVHRDIKPANLLVNRATGDGCITDFSSAMLLARGNAEAVSPTLLTCSLSYMSPEQTGRMNRTVDSRTDLYSLGISFYQLITGRLPFVSDDPMELVHCHIARTPQRPSQLNPSIPEPLSDIVMKLVEKTAEDRYQSAFGLMKDLQRCRDRLASTGTVRQFALARDDRPNRLQVSQKLYGREREVNRLLQAFDRMAQTGRPELVLVAGYSGAGKTSLVREIHKPIVARRGYFISGKYDVQNRDIPYSALIAALRDLVRQLLTERVAVIDRWKERIAMALTVYGQIIVDVIPELELILGPQPPAPILGPAESARRFDRVFLDFIGVFARHDHPLSIFLDDLQWADSASLRLIRLLATSSAENYLLVLGAYRDNEVSQSHPFRRVLHSIEENRGKIEIVTLAPLKKQHVRMLLSDTLRCAEPAVEPLATLLMEKTLGNPFFLWQMLISFYNKGLLTLNIRSGYWEWDQVAIDNTHIADNVLALMTEKLYALSPATQEVLQLAACIGNRFSLHTLALICKQSLQGTLDRLWELLRAGLVVPIGQSAWLLGDSAQGREFDRHIGGSDETNLTGMYEYQFLHDQVQQAGYALIPAPKKASVHLRIGRLMKEHYDKGSEQIALFDVVNHLNLGAELIEPPGEQKDLARLNLAAARKAKSATAYQTALSYTEAGIKILTAESAWKVAYELAFSLYIECAECRFLCGQRSAAEALFREMLHHVSDEIQRSRIHAKQIMVLIGASRLEEALMLGREALHALQVEFVTDPSKEQWRVQDAKFYDLRAGRPIASLIDGPRIDNPRMEAAVDILLSLIPPAYLTRTKRPYGLINVITMVLNIGLEYGYCAPIGTAYATYGLCITNMSRYREAYESSKLGMELNAKLGSVAMGGRITVFFACCQYWREHFRRCEKYWDIAYHELTEAGDYTHASLMAAARTAVRFAQGVNLPDLYQEMHKDLDWIQSMSYGLVYRIIRMEHQFINNLLGQTADRFSLDGNDFSEKEYLAWMVAQNHEPMGLAFYHVTKLMVYYLHGRPREAIAAGAEYLQYEPGATGLVIIADSGFYHALAILAAYRDMTVAEQAIYWAKLKTLLARLKIWADNCPENFLNRYLLVTAEIARVEQRPYEAMEIYDRAIASARENDFIQNVALASELAAKFYHDRGRMQVARAYMADARNAYLQWGAKAKVEQLDQACRSWWHTDIGAQAAEVTAKRMTEHLDLMTIINASRVLSSEIVLETLLEKIMIEILQNAGAERGYLLLPEGDDMKVAALGIVQDEVIETSRPAQVVDWEHMLCRALIDYAWRTGESVVVDDAENDDRCANKDYVKANQVKSILCVPIQRNDEITAILYLENHLAAHAFTADRVELLNLISVQVSVSLENATLYRELRTLNNDLENLVAERTAELRSAQQELLDKAHLAGMAEVAADTVHSVGNLLNSVVTSLNLLQEKLASQPHKRLARANALLRNQLDRVAEFFNQDPRGRKLIDYYFDIEQMMVRYQEEFRSELDYVSNHISSIRGVIYAQQSYAGSVALEANLDLIDLVDKFLLLEEKSLRANNIIVEKKFGAVDKVVVQKTKLMHVLVNLCKNAREAMEGCAEKTLALEIRQDGTYVLLSVSDNGCGIAPEIGSQVFRHGFTTKSAAQGYGLHSCMNYMRAMNGDISVTSAGVGRGATFVLKFPAATADVEAQRLVEYGRL